MEKRKIAIIEALICKTNTLCDANLKISSQEIPASFRNGLYFDETVINLQNNAEIEKSKKFNESNKGDYSKEVFL